MFEDIIKPKTRQIRLIKEIEDELEKYRQATGKIASDAQAKNIAWQVIQKYEKQRTNAT